MKEEQLMSPIDVRALVTKAHRDFMNAKDIEDLLEKIGVVSLGTGPRGFKMYAGTAVMEALPAIKANWTYAPKSKKARLSTKEVPEFVLSQPQGQVDIDGLIADMDHRVSLILDATLEDTIKKVAQMYTGNQVIFKALTEADARRKAEHEAMLEQVRSLAKMVSDATSKLEVLLAPKIAVDPAPVAAEPVCREAATTSSKKGLLHVGIIGITAPATAMIEKEFSEVFKLTMLGPNDAHKIVGMKNCDRVFVLRGKVMSRHMNELKNIGQKPVTIGDSATRIRDALTSYFVESSDGTESV